MTSRTFLVREKVPLVDEGEQLDTVESGQESGLLGASAAAVAAHMHRKPRKSLAIGVLSASVLVLGICGVVLLRRPGDTAHRSEHSGDDRITLQSIVKIFHPEDSRKPPVPCTAFQGNCMESSCCVDGGKDGFQCYQKNKFWAQCLETCEPGVHPDEKQGHYNRWGKFVKDSWSCEKMGARSLPGCDSFVHKNKCPSSRCAWLEGTCKVRCSTLDSADSCSPSHCTWDDGSCIPECGTFANHHSCREHSDRCSWNGSKCEKACFKFGNPDCPSDRCFFEDGACRKDCSTFTNHSSCHEKSKRCFWNGSKCKRACFKYSRDSCPSDRCIYEDDVCINSCSIFSNNYSACIDDRSDRCSWEDDKCEKACFKFDKSTCPSERCHFDHDACKKACFAFPNRSSCTDVDDGKSKRCHWNGSKCEIACREFDKGTCPSGRCTFEDGACKEACGLFSHHYDSCMKHGMSNRCSWDNNQCQKACFKFDKSTCPAERCNFEHDVCKQACFTFPNRTSCTNVDDGKSKRCHWNGSKCEIACRTFDQHTCPSSRCTFEDDECKEACFMFPNKTSCHADGRSNRCSWDTTSNKRGCEQACWKYTTTDTCNKSRCIWDGHCAIDPCSAQGENCEDTKCCSAQRGASGTTCFQKAKGWAQCLETCTSGSHGSNANWTCKALGNRTKFSPGCAFSGDDCSVTHACCNTGFTCAVKDKHFAGCTQTTQKSTWFAKHVPIPANWEGTVLGYGRDEYPCQQGYGDHIAGNSLYCFMAILPSGPEGMLKEIAKKNNASIYGCDAHDVFNSWQTNKAGWDTAEATLVNTDVFIKIWQLVSDRGTYLNYDWTVKVDPDCVFVAQRLKDHIWNLKPPAYTAVYLKNNDMDPGLGNRGFLGAIEVFSKRAAQLYFDNQAGCIRSFAGPSGEDGYFKGCMDALGACYMLDANIFHPDYDPNTCKQGQHVAFHPFKAPNDWQCCWDIIMGKPRMATYGHC